MDIDNNVDIFKSKFINILTLILMILSFVFLYIFMFNPDFLGLESKYNMNFQYVEKLFDDSYVHSVNILIDDSDWQDLLDNAIKEEYYLCDVEIDGVLFSNVGIRAKGNTSLSQIASDETTDRYSFKIEFDHYDKNNLCYGLDKLVLNNTMSDTTYMKDYITYDMMRSMDVAAPYSSFMDIKINGEDWGLYLGVECLEESFLKRNFGFDYGDLYKPDTMEMGGGKDFGDMTPPDREGFKMENMGEMTPPKKDSFNRDNMGEMTPPENLTLDNINGEDFSKTVKENMENLKLDFHGKNDSGSNLRYSDDSYDSYSALFDSAVTGIDDYDKDRLIASLKRLSNGEVYNSLDVNSLINYFVVHNFVCNYDSYTGNMLHNYYLYEKDGIMTMLPWDYNLAFGGFGGMGDRGNKSFDIDSEKTDSATTMVNYDIDNPLSGASSEDRPFWGKLIEYNGSMDLYHQSFMSFINNYFKSGYFENKIEIVYNLIRPYVENDKTAFYNVEEFDLGLKTLKEFCLLRFESIENQLEGKDIDVDASHLNLDDLGKQFGGGDQMKNREFNHFSEKTYEPFNGLDK